MICFLIDDDKDDQEIFMLALEQVDKNFQCITADNSSEGLNKLSPQSNFVPDLIFLDLNMSRISGKQCLVQIKEMSHLRKVPVIIYSTSSDQRDIKETAELGASGFITKPNSIDALSRMLQNITQQYNKNLKVATSTIKP